LRKNSKAGSKVAHTAGSAGKTKYVFTFSGQKAEGNERQKDLLGGKGANLHGMIKLGLPVPPGFTISTEVCTFFYGNQKSYPKHLEAQVQLALSKVEKQMGRKFGSRKSPLLVSVRSGARASMPGMMDTILNLGLNDTTVQGLIEESGDPRFAFDSYRRLITMYSNVVLGISTSQFDSALDEVKYARDVELDTQLTAEDLKEVVEKFKHIVRVQGKEFPEDPWEQLWGAVGAVFSSWMNPRAITYRKLNSIPDDWGTAVNVQAMVFGNMGDDCATGVAFTRDPSTGEKKFFGEFLINAQGEDVVAGIRTPQPINNASRHASAEKLPTLEEVSPKPYSQLVKVYKTLEKHYRDMQDVEFTIERGKLFMLQTRSGKRTAAASLRIAVDMVKERLITKEEAILRIKPEQLDQLLHPCLDPKAPKELIAKGLPASPGAATGQAVFDPETAEKWTTEGKKVILVRTETSPEDIHGMSVAEGILTARGGMTCVAGETRILTDHGFLTSEEAFERIEKGELFRILSVDSRTLRPVWRSIIAAGRKPSSVAKISVSQTGRVEENILRMTLDHKMYTFEQRKLKKKPLEEILAEEGFVQAVSHFPSLGETDVSTALAYVTGAILSDGYLMLSPTKGSVTFVQKPTPEKSDFIAAVEKSFFDAFGVPFSYTRDRTTESTLKGRTIQGSFQDRICFRRDPAELLVAIRDHLSEWVLTLGRTALLHFLAGYVDGDGTYAEESSAVRLQISMSGKRTKMLEGVVLACLRLGIVPQVTSNRENISIQIVEQVEEILAFTQRVRAEIPPRLYEPGPEGPGDPRSGRGLDPVPLSGGDPPRAEARGLPRLYESRCLALRGLVDDIVEHVNFMGRTREGLKRNLMFGAEKLRRDVLPLCPGDSQRELQTILDSSLRSFRIKKVGEQLEDALVYNFEVDASDELDKNFVVFSSRLSPILVSNSHAAVVARGMGKCCVSGCSAIKIHEGRREFTSGQYTVREGDFVTLDGSAGEVILGRVPTISPTLNDNFKQLMKWVDTYRDMGVRTNADTPADARIARKFGAEGIGLCRTEHMFFDPDRIDAVREMILADSHEERKQALEKILPMQKKDFKEIFREMKGFPVTIRLLDPPLHEFIPHQDAEIESLSEKIGVTFERLKRKAESLHEFNPMLGHRGCRLGVSYPEIYRTQVRAIMEAAYELRRDEGFKIVPEIMIPLVGHWKELKFIRDYCIAEINDVHSRFENDGWLKGSKKVEYHIGTMIEIPRAALTADQIAEHAEFFSFGTNDLTQTTFGLSRDDSSLFLKDYIDAKIFSTDPFYSLDPDGVGSLMQIAIEKGRSKRPGIKIGICGEHGGEPQSIQICHQLGLDYVSCSPFRVAIAQLAVAQAVIKNPRKKLKKQSPKKLSPKKLSKVRKK
jgi:phosphoenolpyruvate synthase/pyruvate phosphate dikinase